MVPTYAAPLHLGPLHPVEQGLTLLLAFGPLVLLAVTIWWTRRRNSGDNQPEAPLGSGDGRDDAHRSAPGR